MSNEQQQNGDQSQQQNGGQGQQQNSGQGQQQNGGQGQPSGSGQPEFTPIALKAEIEKLAATLAAMPGTFEQTVKGVFDSERARLQAERQNAQETSGNNSNDGQQQAQQQAGKSGLLGGKSFAEWWTA